METQKNNAPKIFESLLTQDEIKNAQNGSNGRKLRATAELQSEHKMTALAVDKIGQQASLITRALSGLGVRADVAEPGVEKPRSTHIGH